MTKTAAAILLLALVVGGCGAVGEDPSGLYYIEVFRSPPPLPYTVRLDEYGPNSLAGRFVTLAEAVEERDRLNKENEE